MATNGVKFSSVAHNVINNNRNMITKLTLRALALSF